MKNVMLLSLLLLSQLVATQNLDELKKAAQKDNTAKSWNDLANYYYKDRKEPLQLKNCIEKSLELATKTNNIVEIARSYMYSSELYFQSGDMATYLLVNNKALALLNQSNTISLQEEVLNNIATYYGEQDKIDSLLYYVKQAISLNIKHKGDKSQLGSNYQNMAYAYSVMGLADSSIYYSQKTIDALREAKDTLRMLDAYSQMGVAYVKSKNYPKALEYFDGALKIYDLVENKHNRLYIYTNLAATYLNWGKLDKAIEFSSKAISDASKSNEKLTYAKLLSNHGGYLHSDKKYQASIDTLHLALPYLSNSHHYLGMTYQHLAQDYMALDMIDSCEYYLNKVDDLAKRNQFAQSEKFYILRMTILAKQQKYKEAVSYAHKFIEVDSKKHMIEINPDSYNLVSLVLEKGDSDYKKALVYKTKAYAIQDSLYKKESAILVNDFYARYQTAEKELEINKLKQEKQETYFKVTVIVGALILLAILLFLVALYNRLKRLRKEKEALDLSKRIEQKDSEYQLLLSDTELKQTRTYLNGREAEGTRLAKELHDNVANKLYRLEQELKKIDQLPNDILPQMEDLYSDVRNISHELVPPVFQYASLSEILHNYVYVLNEKVNTTLNLRIENEEDLKSLPKELSLEVYRIAQESISNILKHAEAKNAWISLSTNNNQAMLTIEDDGQGFDTEKQQRGIGLQIMKSRCESLQGKFHVSSNIENGTKVEISFPLSQPSVDE